MPGAAIGMRPEDPTIARALKAQGVSRQTTPLVSHPLDRASVWGLVAVGFREKGEGTLQHRRCRRRHLLATCTLTSAASQSKHTQPDDGDSTSPASLARTTSATGARGARGREGKGREKAGKRRLHLAPIPPHNETHSTAPATASPHIHNTQRQQHQQHHNNTTIATSQRSDEHLPTNHGFDEFYGNLYHLNAEEEPEHVSCGWRRWHRAKREEGRAQG